ncbi:MAG: hypothetical protein QM767_10285 [Anaeromyxobacter sp.]
MTTPLTALPSVHVSPTSEQRAQPGRFEEALRGAASGFVSGAAAGLQLAAPYVPGGTVLSAAVRGATSAASSAAAAAASGAASGAAAGAASSGSEGDLLEATRALQQQSQSFNLQYLQLQEGMQRESREFAALSNVMKVKHDTARSTIQNIH